MDAHNSVPASLSGALLCAERGWLVFPAKIEGRSKKGYVSGKRNGGERWGATNDPEIIRGYWAQFPEALLGIATGPSSDLFVIDADTAEAHGGDGVGTLRQWIDEQGGLPDTVQVTTPSGGLHIYFRWPPGVKIKNSSGKLAPGIDIRAEGGMVIAPPSYRTDMDAAYVWRKSPNHFEVAEAPAWLLMRIEDAQGLRAFDPAQAGTVPTINAGRLSEVTELLTYIDPDTGGYDQWCSVLMALHDYTGGSADGLALADKWSARGSKYRPGEVAKKWRSFTPGGGVRLNTIAELARQGGADLVEISRRHKLVVNTGEATSVTSADRPHQANIPEDTSLNHDALAANMGVRGWDQDARYVAIWGKWLFWTGTHWLIDDRLLHLTRTREYLRNRANELPSRARCQTNSFGSEGKETSDEQTRHAHKQARILRSKNTVIAVETLARSNPASVAQPGDFDADRLLLGTPGGTVDLRTGTLRKARRDDWITKQTGVAPASPDSIPLLWLQFLHEVFDGDVALVDFMQRVAGYALTGLTSEHKMLFLHGPGRNGKSVFLNTLSNVCGDYARRAAAETFLNTHGDKHATGIAGLHGARLVVGSELAKGRTWDESLVKDLTGGDRMTARFMRGNFFDFDPQLTLMIAGNTQPSFKGIDDAIRARVILVPFTVKIPPEHRDKALSDKLAAEAPAILRWAIDGALKWQERGLCIPDKVAAASAEYFDDEDVLGQFLEDEVKLDPGAFTGSIDLHVRFTRWCDQQGLDAWTKRTLVKELKGRGYRDAKSNGRRGLKGLRLR